MDDITKEILKGLRQYGRKKTFKEILEQAGYSLSNEDRFALANKLETEGLIKSVTYSLPVSIRAELSNKGNLALVQKGMNLGSLTTLVLSLVQLVTGGPLSFSFGY
jgi:DNA-binding Lrp family transcriptional regulator